MTCSTQWYSKVWEQCFKNCDWDWYQSCAANHGTKKTLYFNKDNAGERIDQTCIQGNRSFSANATCNNWERVNWH